MLQRDAGGFALSLAACWPSKGTSSIPEELLPWLKASCFRNAEVMLLLRNDCSFLLETNYKHKIVQ